MRQVPLKFLCEDAGQYGLNVAASDYRSEGVPLLRTTDISGGSAETIPPLVNRPTDARFMLREGDLLVSRSGSVGESHLVAAEQEDSTFAGYLIRFRPRKSIADSRFVFYLARSDYFGSVIASDAIVSTIANFNADRYANIRVPFPPLQQQRRIADFLDDQVGRIDNIIAARQQQVHLVHATDLAAARDALCGANIDGPRRPSGLTWLGDIPQAWPMATVHAGFEVLLGKMLDEKKFTGQYPVPYLRNTNVQWDRIDTDDLKVMDIAPQELARFTVQTGDLLICEGGQPGRSALWDGSIEPLGFQKALHRARPRAGNDSRWLQLFLRVAVGMSVFANENEQATIAHLTGEQLRSTRIPIPPPHVQRDLIERFEAKRSANSATRDAFTKSVHLLEELKRSLITAAVSGEFDVSTADGSGVGV